MVAKPSSVSRNSRVEFECRLNFFLPEEPRHGWISSFTTLKRCVPISWATNWRTSCFLNLFAVDTNSVWRTSGWSCEFRRDRCKEPTQDTRFVVNRTQSLSWSLCCVTKSTICFSAVAWSTSSP